MAIKTTLIMAMTLNGLIAKNAEQKSLDWTSKEDKQNFIAQTKSAGAVIFGMATWRTINKPLPKRLIIVMTAKPGIETNIDNQVEFTDSDPETILQQLEQRGFNKVIIGGGSTINGLFLQKNLIDEIQITIEPIIWGAGMPLFKNLTIDKKLTLINVKQLNPNTFNLTYKVVR